MFNFKNVLNIKGNKLKDTKKKEKADIPQSSRKSNQSM